MTVETHWIRDVWYFFIMWIISCFVISILMQQCLCHGFMLLQWIGRDDKSCGRSQMHGFSFSRDSTTFSVIVVIVYIVIVVALLFHIVFARWQSFVWPLDWHSRPRKTNERVRINFVVKQWKTGIWICPLGQNLNKGGDEW